MLIENVAVPRKASWACDLKKTAFWALFPVIASLPASYSFFSITSSIFMGLVLLSFFTSGASWSAFKKTWAILLLLFYAVNLLSLTQSAHLDVSLRGTFRVFRYLLLCVSASYVIDSEEKFKKVFYFFLMVIFAISLDGLIQGWTGYEPLRGRRMTAYTHETQRLTGPFHHANDFSAYLSFSSFLFIGILQEGRRFLSSKGYLLCWVGFLAALAALAGTYSRGAWAAVAVSVLLLAIFKKSKGLFAGFALLAAVTVLFSPAYFKDRALSLFDSKSSTIVERKILWGEAVDMIHERPVLGFGVNTYAKTAPLYKSKKVYTDIQYAHNGYLQMAAEIGLVGLTVFLAVLSYFFGSMFGTIAGAKEKNFLRMAAIALIFGILSFLIHSATDTNLQSGLLVNTLWLALGVAWAARNLILR